MATTEHPPAWFRDAIAVEPSQHTTEMDGYRVVYYRWGNGQGNKRPLMLVHGTFAHARWWDCIAPQLADTYEVIALDLPGNGDSDHRPSYSVQLMASCVMHVLQDAGLRWSDGDVNSTPNTPSTANTSAPTLPPHSEHTTPHPVPTHSPTTTTHTPTPDSNTQPTNTVQRTHTQPTNTEQRTHTRHHHHRHPSSSQRPRPYLVGHSFGARVALCAGDLFATELGGVVALDAVVIRGTSSSGGPPISPSVRYGKTAESAAARFRLRPPQRCDNTFVIDRIARQSVMYVEGKGWDYKVDRQWMTKLVRDPAHLNEGLIRACQTRLAWIYGADSMFYAESTYVAWIADALARHHPGTVPIAMTGAAHHLFLDKPLETIALLHTTLTAWDTEEAARHGKATRMVPAMANGTLPSHAVRCRSSNHHEAPLDTCRTSKL
eukprot:m.24763 g.24763  ORF g.24763 m.24763 type:complete len:433 (+) comp4186_c0_seq2:96-1394(+)